MKPVSDPRLLAQLNAVTDPKLLALLNGKAGPDKFDEQIKADLKDSGGYIANFGAGMDNVWQGAKQLVGQGDDDATIEERRKIKGQLAEGSTGGWLTQLAGEIVGSAPLSMGAGAGVGAVASRALPKAAAWAASHGGRGFNVGTVGRGTVEGAAGGALAETTSDESGGLNAGIGATLGAALPAVFAGGAGLAKTMRKKYAPVRAAKAFEGQLGRENLSQIADAVDSPNMSSLPLSTAARSQNVPLAALERGTRSRSGASDWGFDHDKRVAEKAWGDLKGATSNADELPARVADREAMMGASKDELATFDHPTLVRRAANDVSDVSEELRNTPIARQNPEVTNIIGQTEAMLKHPKTTAGDYASQYWRLSNMLDDAKLPTEHRTVIMKLRDAVAQGGDTASGDAHFSDMLGRYAADQEHVGQAESSKAIRESFMSPEGKPLTRKEWVGTPEVTSSQLRRTMATKGENQYGSTLDDPTRAGLDKLQKELGQHELYQSANSPGGTGFNADPSAVATMGSGANNPFNRIWALRGVANYATHGSRKATAEAADAAMRDPKSWQKMMEEYAKSKTPLTPQEYAARMRKQLMLLPGRAGIAGLGGD